jgi:putative transposase
MAKEFPQRKGNRLKGYDYSQDGYYFVTICAKDSPTVFGEIRKGSVALSRYGAIADEEWWDMVHRYPYVLCPAFIVMPDHIHGIIGIDRGRIWKLPQKDRPKKVKSLSSLVAAFKMRVSRRIHEEGHRNFRWQKSFYDHIIRNERSLRYIIEYIEENPRRE